jgi:hypothetical protein
MTSKGVFYETPLLRGETCVMERDSSRHEFG